MKLSLFARRALLTSVFAISSFVHAQSSEIDIPVVPADNNRLSAPPARPEQSTPVQRVNRESGTSSTTNYRPKVQTMQSPIPVIGTTFMDRVKGMWQPQQKVNLTPGDNTIIAVGAGAPNTIKTNFHSVSVKTTMSSKENEETAPIILLEEGYIYVTLNSYTPVSLLVREEGVIDSQVTLVLQPVSAPPTNINLTVNMTDVQREKARAFRIRASQEEAFAKAQKSDQSRPGYNYHEKGVLNLLSTIAKARVPQGFSLTKEIPESFTVPCSMAIEHKTVDRVIGSNRVVDIVSISNNSSSYYQTREEMCLSQDVIAVGVLQKSLLAPGEKTVFLILRERFAERSNRVISSLVME